jgi:hypothetical protein
MLHKNTNKEKITAIDSSIEIITINSSEAMACATKKQLGEIKRKR